MLKETSLYPLMSKQKFYKANILQNFLVTILKNFINPNSLPAILKNYLLLD